MRKDIWICIETGNNNCSAFAPAVPGCACTGKTVEETRKNMEEALTGHLAGMLEDGESLDSITADFPIDPEVLKDTDKDYFALVSVKVREPALR